MRIKSIWPVLALCGFLLSHAAVANNSFVAFESQQFRPLALSPDRTRLYAVNTPDNRLDIFNVSGAVPVFEGAVNVGLEPVAVAVRSAREAWVVNHLSDSVSVVNVVSPPYRVSRTLLVGDEPRDIVFAGQGNSRAFTSAAHRGPNTPWNDAINSGELTTPGIGRTDVWVFDANNLGDSLGGTPLVVRSLFGDSPGPLAASPDGTSVYVGVFKSGNRTTSLAEPIVCNGGALAAPCRSTAREAQSPGGVPAPNRAAD